VSSAKPPEGCALSRSVSTRLTPIQSSQQKYADSWTVGRSRAKWHRLSDHAAKGARGTAGINCELCHHVECEDVWREASSDPSDACRESGWHYLALFDPIRTQNAAADIPINARRPLEGSGTAAVTLALSA
jgi:hypothetical protein